jgi:hypothetical protein
MVVAASAAVGALGLAGGGTAAGILGARLVRSDGAAGVPLACVVVGSAVAALALSRLSARMGRGPALAAGYLAGCAGAAAVVAAADLRSFPLLATGCVPYGAGNAAIFLTRYAAAELGGPAGRGRALAAVLFGTAAGAVASPALLGPTGALAGAVGVEPLAGMFLAAAIVYAAAAALLAGLSLARVSLRRPAGAGAGRRELAAGLGARRARFAIAVLALVNLLMVGIMAVAPVRLAAGGARPAPDRGDCVGARRRHVRPGPRERVGGRPPRAGRGRGGRPLRPRRGRRRRVARLRGRRAGDRGRAARARPRLEPRRRRWKRHADRIRAGTRAAGHRGDRGGGHGARRRRRRARRRARRGALRPGRGVAGSRRGGGGGARTGRRPAGYGAAASSHSSNVGPASVACGPGRSAPDS